jgi:hypothetical protein
MMRNDNAGIRYVSGNKLRGFSFVPAYEQAFPTNKKPIIRKLTHATGMQALLLAFPLRK